MMIVAAAPMIAKMRKVLEPTIAKAIVSPPEANSTAASNVSWPSAIAYPLPLRSQNVLPILIPNALPGGQVHADLEQIARSRSDAGRGEVAVLVAGIGHTHSA
jgi:hypothetical protein